jgi:hypothetical protein
LFAVPIAVDGLKESLHGEIMTVNVRQKAAKNHIGRIVKKLHTSMVEFMDELEINSI